MTSSLVLAILKLQHENVKISVKNRLMSNLSSHDNMSANCSESVVAVNMSLTSFKAK